MDELAGGDKEYCAMLVAINSMLEMVLLAPLAILYLRVISGVDALVSYELVREFSGSFPFNSSCYCQNTIRTP